MYLKEKFLFCVTAHFLIVQAVINHRSACWQKFDEPIANSLAAIIVVLDSFNFGFAGRAQKPNEGHLVRMPKGRCFGLPSP